MEDKKKKEEKKQPEFLIDDRDLPEFVAYMHKKVAEILDEVEAEEKKQNK
jgi:hypothetical protein